MSDPTKPAQVGLQDTTFTTAYHDWFWGHAEKAGECPPRGMDEASSAEIQKIKDGTLDLPHGSSCIFDTEPSPRDCEQTLYWPHWFFEAYDYDTGELRLTAELWPEHPAVDGFVGVTGNDTPTSPANTSSYYRIRVKFHPLSFKARIVYWTGFGANISNKGVIPWVSRG